MFHIEISFTVIIHNHKITGSTFLLLCSYILAVNKHLEFIQEMLVQVCRRFLSQDKIAGGLDRTET
jgi:hypothetical protein